MEFLAFVGALALLGLLAVLLILLGAYLRDTLVDDQDSRLAAISRTGREARAEIEEISEAFRLQALNLQAMNILKEQLHDEEE